MEQEIVNLREDVRYLTGVASDIGEKIGALNQKADTVIGLLRDIRDLLALQQTTGNTFHHRSQAVVDAARSDGRWISERT